MAADVRVHPILVEVPVDDVARVGLVSLTSVSPRFVSIRLISLYPDHDSMWRPSRVAVSIDGGTSLAPAGGGGGGANGWLRWDADFIGDVPEPVGSVTVSLFDPDSSEYLGTVTTPVDSPQSIPPTPDHRAVGEVEAVLAEERQELLPVSVTPIGSAVAGVDDHVVVSLEHWPQTSVLLVYTPDPHHQTPDVPPITTGRDRFDRTYDVRSEGGGTWCGGAASYLRITPRLPDDIDMIHLDGGKGRFGDFPEVTLPFR